MPYNANTELIITETANELISLVDTLERLRIEMNRIASQLPEYPVVLSLHGVGTTLDLNSLLKLEMFAVFITAKL